MGIARLALAGLAVLAVVALIVVGALSLVGALNPDAGPASARRAIPIGSDLWRPTLWRRVRPVASHTVE
ncbi:hypothetical protein, partial [Streptosporangium minutum]